MLGRIAVFLPVVLLLSGVFVSGLRAQQAPAPTQQTEEQKQQMAVEAAIRARQAEALAKRLADPKLFERGESRVYRGENLAAISLPVGGIAAGPIQINGEARRAVWQIFKNHASVPMPNSFFAVRAKTGNGTATLRALQTVAEGPFPAINALSFRGEYPFGWYTFEDDGLPARGQCRQHAQGQ